MGDQHLSSDESIILSTHHILVDAVPLDLMLTSRRLIFIDNTVTPFHLETIPLETIITVVAGTVASGDPIITISSMDPSGTGAPQPKDIIFTLRKGEQRVRECNEWAARLSEHAVSAREKAISAGTLRYDLVKSIKPGMSATYRIETASPRKPVFEARPVVPETVMPAALTAELPVDTGRDAGTSASALSGIPETSPPHAPDSAELEIPDAEKPGVADSGGTQPVLNNVTGSPDPVVPEGGGYEEIARARADEYWLKRGGLTEDTACGEMPAAPAGAPESRDTGGTGAGPGRVVTAVSGDTVVSAVPAMPERTDDEKPASPQQRAETPAGEDRVVTDVERAWAEAVRSAASLPLAIHALPAQELTPAAISPEDESADTGAQTCTTPEKPAVKSRGEAGPAGALTPEYPAGVVQPVQPLTKSAHLPAAPALPALSPKKRWRPFLAVTAIVIVALLVVGGVFMGSLFPPAPDETPAPAAVPAVTVQQTPMQHLTIVPADGVWVRIDYPGYWIGEVGNPELMHPVSGPGAGIYKIRRDDGLVQVSAQKQENSGDTLVVEVYKNGTLVKCGSTRVPMGSVTILIDPITGYPPGIKPGKLP